MNPKFVKVSSVCLPDANFFERLLNFIFSSYIYFNGSSNCYNLSLSLILSVLPLEKAVFKIPST